MECKYSPNLVNFFEVIHVEYLKKLYFIRKWVRKMIYAKNRVIKALKDIEDYVADVSDLEKYPITKEDYMTIGKFVSVFKEKNLLTFSNIWKLDRKEKDKEVCDEYEISE